MQDYLSTLGILRYSRFMSANREGLSGYQPRRNFRRGPGYGPRTYGRGGRRMETAGNFYEVPKKVFNVPLPIGPLQTTESPQNPAEETPPLAAKVKTVIIENRKYKRFFVVKIKQSYFNL